MPTIVDVNIFNKFRPNKNIYKLKAMNRGIGEDNPPNKAISLDSMISSICGSSRRIINNFVTIKMAQHSYNGKKAVAVMISDATEKIRLKYESM